MDCKWTEERVDELIMLLEERPCLYNTTLKDYFNRNSKRKALEEIATTLAIADKATPTNCLVSRPARACFFSYPVNFSLLTFVLHYQWRVT